MPLRKRQSGSALVLAILVAAIVAAMGVELAYGFMLASTRVENRLLDQQARLYLLAAEELAVAALTSDALSSSTDTLLEPWAQALPPLPTEDGWVQVAISDAQGRFNLNNLATSGESVADLGLPLEQRFTATQLSFVRLLQELGEPILSEAEALALTEALIDWVDADDQSTGFGGAESLYYVNESPAYRPANRLLRSSSELQLVRHVTPDLYRRLLPLVVVLPEPAALNLNTAAPALLGALLPAGNQREAQWQQLLRRQTTQPWVSVDEVGADPLLAPALQGSGTQRPYGVSSRYFQLQARVQHSGVERTLQSLLYRGEEGVQVLTRQFGSPLDLPLTLNGPEGPGT